MNSPNIVEYRRPIQGGGLVEDTTAEEGSNGLTVWTPAQLLSWNPPADDVILGEADRGYIVREELTVVIGPPGTGKSRLMTWGSICAITGRSFAGLPTQNGPTKWLLIGNENSRRRQRFDLERMLSSLTEAERKLVEDNLRIHVLDQARDSYIDLGDPLARAAITATLKEHLPDVVVFDPWANMVPGDENKNSDVRDGIRYLLSMVRLAAPRAACVVVHHARTGAATVAQAGNRFSGASLSRGGKALPSAARCEIAVWPGDSEDSGRIVVTCEKSNNAPVFAPRGLLLDQERMTYSLDPAFSVDGWRDDVKGERKALDCSISDVHEVVKELCPDLLSSARASEVYELVAQKTGASLRTIKRRAYEGQSKGYLRQEKRGFWKLGSKPLKGHK